MEVLIILTSYLAIINIAAFAAMGIDKLKAKKRAWRIPEATLFLLVIFGGSLGGILGMFLFRHKTRHWYFVVGMPLILLMQIAAVVFYYCHFGRI